MTVPQITITDCAIGETFSRDMNETELELHNAQNVLKEKNAKLKIKAEQELENKRQIILDRLGITADELKIILP